MQNNFGGTIIQQVSTDTLYIGGQSLLSLIANNYLTLSSPTIFGNGIAGASSSACFNFVGSINSYGGSSSAPAKGFKISGDFALQ